MNPLKHIIPDSEEIMFSEINHGDVLAFRNAGVEKLSYQFITVTERNLPNLGHPDALFLRVKKRGLPTEIGSIIEARRIRNVDLQEPILLIRKPLTITYLDGLFQTLDFKQIPGISSTTVNPESILDWREVDIIPRDL